MTNWWNHIIYALWAPLYDRLIEQKSFVCARRRAIDLLELQPGEKILIIGIGTGADLPLLPHGVEACGIDLSAPMLRRARLKLDQSSARVQLRQADAQQLPYEDGVFDAAILILILSVVPDPRRCLQEAARVLRPGGRAVVYDKFLPSDTTKPRFTRRLLNGLTRTFGTDINRRFEDSAAGLPFKIILDEPGFLSGFYRTLLLRKPGG